MRLLNRLLKPFHHSTLGSIPFIKQSQPGGDGLACIAMLFSYHGINIGSNELTKSYAQFCQGINLRAVMEILQVNGLSVRALHCPMKEINHVQLPCILHWDMKQFVVLSDIQDGCFSVIDPASRRLALSCNEFEKHYGEIALEVVNKLN